MRHRNASQQAHTGVHNDMEVRIVLVSDAEQHSADQAEDGNRAPGAAGKARPVGGFIHVGGQATLRALDARRSESPIGLPEATLL